LWNSRHIKVPRKVAGDSGVFISNLTIVSAIAICSHHCERDDDVGTLRSSAADATDPIVLNNGKDLLDLDLEGDK